MSTLLEILNDPRNQTILQRQLTENVIELVDRADEALNGARSSAAMPGIPRPRGQRGAARPSATIPAKENFPLSAAAATEPTSRVLKSRSLSGIWTIEVFEGASEEDRATGRGSILLTVDPKYHASYEGLNARVFVKEGDTERTLLEQRVQRGELLAPVSLAGLDLRSHTAISVVFSSPPTES